MTDLENTQMNQLRFKKEIVGAPELGIRVYKNVLDNDANIPERLESSLAASTHPYFRWHDSLVGEGTKMPEYRDCVDFKFDKNYISATPSEFDDIVKIYSVIADAQNYCLHDYQGEYNINMQYMEAINFVRYKENQHFNIHTDHGFSYVCTVSAVMYLNDSYIGGELWFPNLNTVYAPAYGDLIFFPSTYIYAHASLPIKSGTKYSAVTMYDYNSDTHQHGGFTRDFGQQSMQPYK